MAIDRKAPMWQFLLASFCGGMLLSALELFHMFTRKEAPDIYFFGGMIMAGIIGMAGPFLSRVSDIGGALTSGIAAPQLLGSIGKAATGVAQASVWTSPTLFYAGIIKSVVTQIGITFALVASPVHAQPSHPPHRPLPPPHERPHPRPPHPPRPPQQVAPDTLKDSIETMIVVSGIDKPLKLMTADNTYRYMIKEKFCQIMIPVTDYMLITGEDFSKTKFKIPEGSRKIMIHVEITYRKRTQKILKGLFAQQSYDHFLQKLTVKVNDMEKKAAK